jgi:hypothetical protein
LSNRAQETTFNKISALFESKKQKIKESRSANEVFELLGIILEIELNQHVVFKSIDI